MPPGIKEREWETSQRKWSVTKGSGGKQTQRRFHVRRALGPARHLDAASRGKTACRGSDSRTLLMAMDVGCKKQGWPLARTVISWSGTGVSNH